jgi:hypothetical protein
MKASAILAVASLLAAAVGAAGSSLAAEGGGPPAKSKMVLSALAGTAVPAAELGNEHGRGVAFNVNGSALNSAGSSGNAVVNSPVSGMIDNSHSIDNNAGITSVVQNLGANSVLQVSTTINITLH